MRSRLLFAAAASAALLAEAEGGTAVPLPAFAALLPGAVTITDDTDEGIACFKIVTDSATYYYDKAGAGFTSMLDRDGIDWINFHPWGGSDGAYRGIPNMGLNVFGHPGYTGATSTTPDQKDVTLPKATVSSTKDSWSVTWEFFPTYAKMTVHSVGENYWFLYEGTPGGAVGADDVCRRSDGQSSSCSTSWSGDVTNTSGAAAGTEWVYFADGSKNRSLFLIHDDDSLAEEYWMMENNMTVFGFGRTGLTRHMSRTPAYLVIGFAESRDHDTVKGVIDAAWGGLPPPDKVASPSISPAGGTFAGPVSVTISCATAGATIRYTTDGSTPSSSHGTVYTGAFTVSQSCTLKAIAYKSGMTDSDIASVSFTIATLRDPENPSGLAQGLNVSYYALSSPGALPDFGSLTAYKTDTVSQIDYPSTDGDFATSGRADNVGAVFSGYVEAPSDGVYTFYTESDDGSALYIGSAKVVDNDGLHAMQERSGQIGLRAGKHTFRVEFFEAGGGAGLVARWEGQGVSKQAIPANRLYRTGASGSDSDGDGIPDTWEVQYFGSPGACDPNADPDSDGLTNSEEYQRGTNPIDNDSDDDGMFDGFEVDHGFNPLSGDQDGNGTLDGQDDWDSDGTANSLDSTPGAPPGGGGAGFSCGGGGSGLGLVLALLGGCGAVARARGALRRRPRAAHAGEGVRR